MKEEASLPAEGRGEARRKEQGKIIRFAFTVGSFTMLSRFLGMLRDILTASLFGTSLAFSAFSVAFQIPNLFRALFGEGALSAALVPVFMRTKADEGTAAAWLMARRVLTLAGTVLLGVTALGVLGMSAALPWTEAGGKAAWVLKLGRVMFPYVFFICMAALSMALLNAHKEFSRAAFTPALMNVTWILSVLLVIPHVRGGVERQIMALAWTVFAAGALQMLYQAPGLWKVGWRPGLDFAWGDARVRRVLLLMGPAALGMALNQVNVMLSSILAIHAGEWAPAALFYATRLIYFPQGILAVSLSTVLLPVLSAAAAKGDREEMAAAVHHGLRTLLFVMTPAAAGLFALSHPLVRMLLERGNFGEASTMLTARALSVFAPGLLVFCLAKVFVPAFYALQDTKTPVKIGMGCVLVTLCCNVLAVCTLPEYWRHAGMAGATVVSECVNGVALAVLLRRRIGPFGLPAVARGFARVLLAAAAMALAAWAVERGLAGWLAGGGAVPLRLQPWCSTLPAVALGAAVYVALARALRCPELGFVLDAFRKKRAKAG